uniref:Lipocalin n=1 Tax=Rhipicephalus zambeziensis TaxID=60191 RepID=A0A224YN80_9ACAR
MHLYLIAIVFFHVLSLQRFCSAGVPFWELQEFLNTGRRIWLYATSQPLQWEGYNATCIYYRTKNLTDTSVALSYQAVWNTTLHGNITVQATLIKYPIPSMTMTDWNGKHVKKELQYYSKFLWCAIFFVRLIDDEIATGPWCELHVYGLALREAFKNGSSFTECDGKFNQICGKQRAEITLVTKNCTNIKKQMNE